MPSINHAHDTFPSTIGSGKTTLSTSLQSHLPAYNFQRLSIDCIVYERHGIYSVDFPAELGEKYQEEADEIFHASTVQQLEQIPPSNLILDRAFYAKKDRDEYRRLVEDRGAKTILVYLQADRDTLWRRIQERKARIGGRVAGAAFEVTEDILSSYLDGFQCPRGEGEFVINIS